MEHFCHFVGVLFCADAIWLDWNNFGVNNEQRVTYDIRESFMWREFHIVKLNAETLFLCIQTIKSCLFNDFHDKLRHFH